MARLPRIGVLALLGTSLVAPSVLAQQQAPEPSPNVTVEERRRPQFDPLGIRAGGFLIFPRLQLGLEYDSNVFATENNEEDDFGLLIRPGLSINSQWSRHALNLTAFGDFALYEEFDENNYQDFGASVDGRLDITRSDVLNGSLSLARRHEGRDDPESTRAGDIRQYFDGLARLAYRKEFTRVFGVIGGSIGRLDYIEGNFDEDVRDRNTYGIDLRVGYEISPRFDVFVQGDYSITKYDRNRDNAGFEQDSTGWGISVGTAIDFTGLLFGEASVGFIRRDYDDGDLDDINGPGAAVNLTWNVTTLTSILFDASSAIVETTQFGASGNLRSTAGVEVQHELLRNLILIGRLGLQRDDFEGIDRTDHTFRARAGARYLLNRNLSLDGGYEFATRDSDVRGADYDRHVLRIALTGRL
ncbi:MAG: outer membrane beta-barrel protein [Geminicoccaceae bacterium]|nr:outer membrane beta-barrel protein [Geminicoccaceae bacterium]